MKNYKGIYNLSFNFFDLSKKQKPFCMNKSAKIEGIATIKVIFLLYSYI
jgi:hypothetical protein